MKVDITKIKKRKVDMTKGVGEEHIYESPKNEEATPLAASLIQKRKKNYMMGKQMNLKM